VDLPLRWIGHDGQTFVSRRAQIEIKNNGM
jgi:hypothetical protein